MKKLLLVLIIIIVVVAGVYFGAAAVVKMKLQNETRAMNAAGYPTTIAGAMPKVTPGGREAAQLIRAAYDTVLVHAGTGREQSRELGNLDPADSMDYSDDPALYGQIMDRYSAAIPLLLKAADYPEITFPFQYEQGWAMSLDSVPLAVQTGSRMLRIYVKVCFAQGRTDEAVRALRAGIHLATGIKDNFALMTIVRNIQLRASFNLVHKFAPRLPPAALAALQTDIEAADAPGIYRAMLESEMALAHQTIVTATYGSLSELMPGRALLNAALTLPPVNNYACLANMAATRRQIELGARPWYQSHADWDRDSLGLGVRNWGGALGRLFMFNARLFYTRLERERAENEVTQLGLAVLRYRAEHGRLPETVEAAGGPKLVDPFSGQSYLYRPGPDGFLLYSIGSDMKDDGGAAPKDLGWQAKI